MKLAEATTTQGWTRGGGEACTAFVRGSARGLWVERRSGGGGWHESQAPGQGLHHCWEPMGHLCARYACGSSLLLRGCHLPR